MPTQHGESVMLRLLNQSANIRGLDGLGMPAATRFYQPINRNRDLFFAPGKSMLGECLTSITTKARAPIHGYQTNTPFFGDSSGIAVISKRTRIKFVVINELRRFKGTKRQTLVCGLAISACGVNNSCVTAGVTLEQSGLATLPDGCIAAYIPNPNANPRSLLAMLAMELGCMFGRNNKPEHRFLESISQRLIEVAINERLIEIADLGGRVVVCIDEAQAMPIATLETVRLLSNLETEKRKLLQVILFGQPELDQKLSRPEIRQLRQRITFEYALGPLTREEVSHYLSHRLIVAGFAGGACSPDLRPGPSIARAVAFQGWSIFLRTRPCCSPMVAGGGRSVDAMHVQPFAIRRRQGARRGSALDPPPPWVYAPLR